MKRFVIAILLAIPVGIAISLLCGIVMLVMIGPWGGALDGLDQSELPEYVFVLGYLLQFAFYAGCLWIGWRWAGMILARDSERVAKWR